MSAAEVREQLEVVAKALARADGWMDIAEVRRQVALEMGRPVHDRTLSRRLGDLVDAGRAERVGHGASTRYRRIVAEGEPPAADGGIATPPAVPEDDYIPLSAEGLEIRTLGRRPEGARTPVGYHEQFLRDYEPGTTWYLSEARRATLHQLGRTSDAERPAGTFARDIHERLLIDLAWSSSRLEGNTYSRLDTERLLQQGIRAEGKDASEAQMILNHKKAIEFLIDDAESIAFNRFTLLNLHAALAENLLDDAVDEGRVRTRMVRISGSTFQPLAIPQKLDELFSLMLEKAAAIPDPFEQSFFIMVQLPYLQPFADVNKRTSRLAANIPLIRQNLAPLSFIGVPERAYVEGTLGVYELGKVALLRDVFMWAYERSCQQYRVVRESLGEPDPIRLRYRQELATLIRQVVTQRHTPSDAVVRRFAEEAQIPADDHAAFVTLAHELLATLHEGNFARYGIRASEFTAWKSLAVR